MGGDAISNGELTGRGRRMVGGLRARVESLAQPVPGHELADIRFERRTAIGPRSARALAAIVAALVIIVGGGMLIGYSTGGRGDEGVVTVGGLSPTGTREPLVEETAVASTDYAGDAGNPGRRGQTQGDDGGTVGMVVVAVQGMVGSPGLRTVATDTRLGELLDASGGTLPEAHLEGINLAEKVVDGMQVVVDATGSRVTYPGNSVTTGTGSAGGGTVGAPSGSATVNINTADIAGLSTLPGVGQKTAEAIIAWRERNGPFTAPEQLMEVKGIGVAKFEAMRDSVST